MCIHVHNRNAVSSFDVGSKDVIDSGDFVAKLLFLIRPVSCELPVRT